MNKKFRSIIGSCLIANAISFVNASESNIRPEIVEHLKEFCSANNHNYNEMLGAVNYACDCTTSGKENFCKNYEFLLQFFESYSSLDSSNSNWLSKISEKYEDCFRSPPMKRRLQKIPTAPRFEDGPEYRELMKKLGRPLNE